MGEDQLPNKMSKPDDKRQGVHAIDSTSSSRLRSHQIRDHYKAERNITWYDSERMKPYRMFVLKLVGLLPFVFFECLSVYFFASGSPFPGLSVTASVLITHGFACVLLPLALYPWLPRSYRETAWLSTGLIWGFSFTLPVLGPGCIVLILKLVKKVDKCAVVQKRMDWVVGSRVPNAEGLDFTSGQDSSESILQVMNGADPLARRNLVLATKRLPAEEAVPVLRTGLRDSDEEVKLYSQAILSKLVERYEAIVADLKKEYEEKPMDSGVTLRLAEQYCEIVELDLITDHELQLFYLNRSVSLLEDILKREPGNDHVWRLLAKYQLMVNKPDQALNSVEELRALGVSNEVLAPVEIEALFQKRRWSEFRKQLTNGVIDRFCDPQLQSLGEFWIGGPRPSHGGPGAMVSEAGAAG